MEIGYTRIVPITGSDDSISETLVLEVDGQRVAKAVFFYSPVELRSKRLFLGELVVMPEHNGKGYSKSLLAHFAKTATQSRSGKLEWSVANKEEFYALVGAYKINQLILQPKKFAKPA